MELLAASASVGILGALNWYRQSRSYPYTRRDDTHETFESAAHGQVVVHEPYLWLHDPDSDETTTWVNRQKQVTDTYLQKLAPVREGFLKRMQETLNYPRMSCPSKRGSRYYFSKNDGLQNHSVLYSLASLPGQDEEEKPQVIIDPNTWSEDASVAHSGTYFSKNGEYIVYGVQKSGSDWRQFKIKNLATLEDLEEELTFVKFASFAWTHDAKGFFYNRYPELNRKDLGTETNAASNQSVYYHVLGTPQSADVKLFSATDLGSENYLFGLEVSDDGDYLLVGFSDSCDPTNALYYASLKDFVPSDATSLKLVPVIRSTTEAGFDYITNEGTRFFFKTDLDAVRSRVICMDLATCDDRSTWGEVIPEHKTDLLEFVSCVGGDKLAVAYLHDVCQVLKLFDLQGSVVLDEVPLPCLGSVVGMSGRKEDDQMFFSFQSFLYPGIIFCFDCNTLKVNVFHESRVPGFDASALELKQVFVRSKDGTRVPMFLVHKRGLELDGNNPTILYGYGGFNISLRASFSSSIALWCQHTGGVYAYANLRGGGEYGKEWHKAGTKLRKQNVFDDFIAAAEFLIDEKYTNKDKLAVSGGSNGGLLVGAVVNQRPELFACAVPRVGVMDMLRFHRFTIGYAWMSDYGSSDDPEQFDYLYGYSPVHNVRDDVPYPSILVTTADHDDRVSPLHSFKYTAQLQRQLGEKSFQQRPLLCRIESKAGHGAGKALKYALEEQADILSFIVNELSAEATFE